VYLNNLGRLYEGQARYDDSEKLLLRVFSTRERLLGVEHPDTLRSLLWLARLYAGHKRPAKAVPLLERVLAGSERVLGTQHPETREICSELERTRQQNEDAP
jgi:hypothetical protein